MQGQRARRGREGRSHATTTTAAAATASEQAVVLLHYLKVFGELGERKDSPLRRGGEEGVELVGV